MAGWTTPRWAHMWHLMALMAFVAVVYLGRDLDQGLSLGSALLSLPPHLYRWTPVLAGVALATRGLGRAASRHALEVGLAALVLMLALDMSGELVPVKVAPRITTRDGQTVESVPVMMVGAPESWVLTGIRATRGELSEAAEQLTGSYPMEHPRVRVALALGDAGMVLVLAGILGILLGIGGLLEEHVIFRSPRGERIVHVVFAWCVGPVIVGFVAARAGQLQLRALFRGGSLVQILFPALVVFAAGVVWWVAIGRRQQPTDVEALRPAA